MGIGPECTTAPGDDPSGGTVARRPPGRRDGRLWRPSAGSVLRPWRPPLPLGPDQHHPAGHVPGRGPVRGPAGLLPAGLPPPARGDRPAVRDGRTDRHHPARVDLVAGDPARCLPPDPPPDRTKGRGPGGRRPDLVRRRVRPLRRPAVGQFDVHGRAGVLPGLSARPGVRAAPVRDPGLPAGHRRRLTDHGLGRARRSPAGHLRARPDPVADPDPDRAGDPDRRRRAPAPVALGPPDRRPGRDRSGGGRPRDAVARVPRRDDPHERRGLHRFLRGPAAGPHRVLAVPHPVRADPATDDRRGRRRAVLPPTGEWAAGGRLRPMGAPAIGGPAAPPGVVARPVRVGGALSTHLAARGRASAATDVDGVKPAGAHPGGHRPGGAGRARSGSPGCPPTPRVGRPGDRAPARVCADVPRH